MFVEQLRLLEVKRAEGQGLRRLGGEPNDDFADDLAGIRSVLRAALLFNGRLIGTERDESEQCEREATNSRSPLQG